MHAAKMHAASRAAQQMYIACKLQACQLLRLPGLCTVEGVLLCLLQKERLP